MASPGIQHTISAAPLLATGAAIAAHAPEVLSCAVALASLFYYYLVITDKLAQRRAVRDALKQSADRVAIPILEDRHADTHDDHPPSAH